MGVRTSPLHRPSTHASSPATHRRALRPPTVLHEDPVTKRKAQNQRAQKTFRERKKRQKIENEEAIVNLTKKVADLESALQAHHRDLGHHPFMANHCQICSSFFSIEQSTYPAPPAPPAQMLPSPESTPSFSSPFFDSYAQNFSVVPQTGVSVQRLPPVTSQGEIEMTSMPSAPAPWMTPDPSTSSSTLNYSQPLVAPPRHHSFDNGMYDHLNNYCFPAPEPVLEQLREEQQNQYQSSSSSPNPFNPTSLSNLTSATANRKLSSRLRASTLNNNFGSAVRPPFGTVSGNTGVSNLASATADLSLQSQIPVSATSHIAPGPSYPSPNFELGSRSQPTTAPAHLQYTNFGYIPSSYEHVPNRYRGF